MTDKQKAIDAIRNVHADTDATLEEVKEALEELSDLASELADAVADDIKMQS